jgi:hypothetical protein
MFRAEVHQGDDRSPLQSLEVNGVLSRDPVSIERSSEDAEQQRHADERPEEPGRCDVQIHASVASFTALFT